MASPRSARALEERGDLAEAAEQYLADGQPEQCARVLAALGRFADAAHVLTAILGDQPWHDEPSRGLAYKAATYLWHAGDAPACAALLLALGDDARASAVLSTEPPRKAAPRRRSTSAGRAGPASAKAKNLLERSGVFHDAGVRLFEAQRWKDALGQFLRVSRSAPTYRSAALYVIRLALASGAPTFEIIDFLRPFVAAPPHGVEEIEALHRLGVLYQEAGLDQDAGETLAAVVAADPGHADAAARLAKLPVAAGVAELAASLEQDLSFWAAAPPRARRPSAESRASRPSATPGVTSQPAAGAEVAGRYRLEDEIGRGGMGAVFRALDLELDQHVALKLYTQPIADASLVARFKQELMLCRQITHRNVIRVYDIGTHEGRKFLTMELLFGGSLRSLFGQTDQRTMFAHLLQLTEALSEVHRRGVVHRDVKPANVFVTEEGVVKLMDFGLAKRVEQNEGLTASGFMAGSPGYMAPEQVTSFGTVTAAADLYALGVILYEVLTGMRPFRDKDANKVIHLQFTTTPQPPSELQAMPHPALEPLVLGLLEREPERRPPVEAVQSVLRKVLTRR